MVDHDVFDCARSGSGDRAGSAAEHLVPICGTTSWNVRRAQVFLAPSATSRCRLDLRRTSNLLNSQQRHETSSLASDSGGTPHNNGEATPRAPGGAPSVGGVDPHVDGLVVDGVFVELCDGSG